MTNRISTDLREKKKMPRVMDYDSLTDDRIPGIDECCPVYQGYDRHGNIWIGEQSVYDTLDETVDFENSGHINEQSVEIVVTDSNYGTEVSRGREIFNSMKFKKALTEGILHFMYRKVNGDMRDAYGTTKVDVLISNGCRMVFDRHRKLGENIRYYDMNSRGWRSFKPDNLLKIYEEADMSQAN